MDAMIAAIHYGGDEHIFNIGSGQGKTLLEVLSVIEHVTNLPVKRCFMPGRDFDVPSNVLSIERARTRLKWSPNTDFRDGVMRMFDWYKIHNV